MAQNLLTAQRLPPTASVDEVFNFIKPTIELIFRGQEVNYLTYMTVYSAVNNSLVRAKGSMKKDGDLYWRIYDHFNDPKYFPALREQAEPLRDEELLRWYTSEWTVFETATKKFNNMMNFINRHWVKRERDEGRKTIYPVDKFLFRAWREHLFLHIQSPERRITNALLKLLKEQRDGEQIDASLVKDTVASMIALGIKDVDVEEECLTVYEAHFETDFLEASAEHYRKVTDAGEDLDRLKEEEEQFISTRLDYLHEETKQKLRREWSPSVEGS